MTSCCFFVSLSSLCFATDEDGCDVENFCNTLFKCIYNLHEEMFCLNVILYSHKSVSFNTNIYCTCISRAARFDPIHPQGFFIII